MAKAPTPGRVEDAGPDDLSITITIEGQSHTVWPEMLTASDVRAIRLQTGFSVRTLFDLAHEDADLDVLAALVWIARCQAGEQLTIDDVAAGVTYSTKFDVEEKATAVPEDHPSS